MDPELAASGDRGLAYVRRDVSTPAAEIMREIAQSIFNQIQKK